MFEEMITLASSSIFSSGALGEMLTKWEEAGFFSYLLPFLLIFALVFGILVKVKVFNENKMVNGIIALSVALMSLQFDFVPSFFSQMFPRVGVGLAIILGILIIVGLFAPKESEIVNYVLAGIGVIIIGIIIIQSAGSLGWSSGTWWEENWELVAGAAFILIILAVIVGAGSNAPKKQPVPFIGEWAK